MIFDIWADLLLGKRCAACGKLVAIQSGPLCDLCREKFDEMRIMLPDRMPLILSLYRYDRTYIRHAMLRYKYYNAKQFGRFAAGELAAVLREYGVKPDGVMGIPSSGLRDGRRYNQSEYLAWNVARELGVPFLQNVLRKNKKARSQVRMPTLAARKRNADGAFRKGPAIAAVAGKQILLVDDIVTSGSTLDACRSILAANGANSVLCCTYARKHIRGFVLDGRVYYRKKRIKRGL